jgi:hypothetical protein
VRIKSTFTAARAIRGGCERRRKAGQVDASVADPSPLAGDAQQLLRDGQAHQLRVGQCRLAAWHVIT